MDHSQSKLQTLDEVGKTEPGWTIWGLGRTIWKFTHPFPEEFLDQPSAGLSHGRKMSHPKREGGESIKWKQNDALEGKFDSHYISVTLGSWVNILDDSGFLGIRKPNTHFFDMPEWTWFPLHFLQNWKKESGCRINKCQHPEIYGALLSFWYTFQNLEALEEVTHSLQCPVTWSLVIWGYLALEMWLVSNEMCPKFKMHITFWNLVPKKLNISNFYIGYILESMLFGVYWNKHIVKFYFFKAASRKF